MTSSDVQSILGNANCESCHGATQSELLKLGLLNRVIANAVVSNFVARSSISDAGQIAALRTLVQSAMDNGWWDKCELIYPFVGGTALAHSQNLKSSSFTITWNGTVTHNANGITGTGSGYGDTNYIPALSQIWQLDSAHISLYRRTIGNVGGYYCGLTNSTQGSSGVGYSASGTSSFGSLNDNTPVNTTFSDLTLGFVAVARLISESITYFSSGANLTAVQASTQVVVNPNKMHILGRNVVGVGNQSKTTANLASFTFGSGITPSETQLMSSDWQTFQTALGRQV